MEKRSRRTLRSAFFFGALSFIFFMTTCLASVGAENKDVYKLLGGSDFEAGSNFSAGNQLNRAPQKNLKSRLYVKYEYFEKDNACSGVSSIGYLIKEVKPVAEFNIYGKAFKAVGSREYRIVGYYPGSEIGVALQLYQTGGDAPDHDFLLIEPNGGQMDHVSFPWPSPDGNRFVYSVSGAENEKDNGLYWFSYDKHVGFGVKHHLFLGKSICDIGWNNDGTLSFGLLDVSSNNIKYVKRYTIK